MTVVGWPEGWQDGMSCCFLGQSCNNTGRPELPTPPPPACSQGSAGIKERVNSGEASSLCLVRSESNDRGPVPPLPSLRLSWKPRLAGSREQWVPPRSLGPCPPHPPPSPCQAWHFPLPKGAGLLDQGKELSSALLSGLDFLPGKMAPERGLGDGTSLDFAVGGASLGVRVIFVCLGVHTKVLPQAWIPSWRDPMGRPSPHLAQSGVLGVPRRQDGSVGSP